MFKMPTVERLQEIADMIPEAISVFSEKSTGYNSKIAKIGEMMRLRKIAKELEINISYPININDEELIKMIDDNFIPDFAALQNSNGRLRISFGDDDESDPVMALTRDFYEECSGGYIYSFSKNKLNRRVVKRMRRCAISWHKNMLTSEVKAFM